MSRRLIGWPLLACLCISAGVSTAHACEWDRDTIAEEALHFPDLVDVATGRFDRNPPLYYQMRLDRVTKEVAADPTKLDDYDDAAVACDRLGDDDAALKWMARKRTEMKALTGTAIGISGFYVANKDTYTYRLLANEGTFFAHKWFRAGRHVEQLRLLDRSIADLEAAIKLNPNAHFGRETIQKSEIEWVKHTVSQPKSDETIDLSRGSEPTKSSLYSFLSEKGFDDAAIQKGLSGLVVLGNAWESPDTYMALAQAIPEHQGNFRIFVAYRAEELEKSGLMPLGPGLNPDWDRMISPPELLPTVRASYALLRRASDREHERRTDYITSRLKHGRHPDADPTFWSEWKPTVRPEFVDPPWGYRAERWLEHAGWAQTVVMIACCCGVPLGFMGLVLYLVRRWTRRKGGLL